MANKEPFQLTLPASEIDAALLAAKNAVTHTPQTLTPEQQEQARENIDAARSIEKMPAVNGEISNWFSNGGKLTFDAKALGCFIKVKPNTDYKVTVKGEHNRFYINAGFEETIIVGTTLTSLYNSKNTETRTDTEFYTVNSADYKALIVTVGYGLTNPTVSVEYTEGGDRVVRSGNIEWYTASAVDKLLSHLAKTDDVEQMLQPFSNLVLGGTVYTTESNVSNVATTEEVHALYDSLAMKYPSYITKNVLGQNSQGKPIPEYVFTSGDYNDVTTARPKDDIRHKPTVLVISGVHGCERSSVMATYQFFRDMADYSTALYALREGLEFRVIPVVTPYSFDNDVRTNENGVNINLNFGTSTWTQADVGASYSGAAPADQIETQIVQSWLKAHANAYLFVDHHNSGYEDEVSMIFSRNTDDKMSQIKGSYLQGLSKIIPHWKDKKDFPDSLVFAYTGTDGHRALSIDYAEENGITNICIETSWNQNAMGKHSAESIAVGAEAFGNMLLAISEKIPEF